MTKGSTKAVTVSSPSSNQASTWKARKGRIIGNGAPPTGKKRKQMKVRTCAGANGAGITGYYTTYGSEVLHSKAHAHTSPATADIQREQAGTDMHNSGIKWERFQVSLTDCWLVNEADGTPRLNTPTATSIPWEPKLGRKNPVVLAGAWPTHTPPPQPKPGKLQFHEGAREGG